MYTELIKHINNNTIMTLYCSNCRYRYSYCSCRSNLSSLFQKHFSSLQHSTSNIHCRQKCGHLSSCQKRIIKNASIYFWRRQFYSLVSLVLFEWEPRGLTLVFLLINFIDSFLNNEFVNQYITKLLL